MVILKVAVPFLYLLHTFYSSRK